MKKYLIGLGILVVAAFAMLLPYLLRRGDPPAGSASSPQVDSASSPQVDSAGSPQVDSTGLPREEKTEPKSDSKTKPTLTPAVNPPAQQPTAGQPSIQPKPADEPKTEIAQLVVVAVDISGFAFAPSRITVKKGTIVKWTNQDPIIHTVTGDTAGPDSDFLNKGQSYQFTFNEVGVFNYHCTPHPSMKGTVEVTN